MRPPTYSRLIATVAALLLGYTLTPTLYVFGQTPTTGNKVVYSSSSAITGSSAFVDATAFQFGRTDICQIINAALQTLPPTTGGVVDARGIQNAGNPLSCAANTTPWLQPNGTGGYTFTTTPADILLPMANICIVTPWIIPSQTRVFGVGMDASQNQTTISAYYTPNPTSCSFTTNFSDGNVPTGDGPTMVYMGYNGTPSGSPPYPSPPCGTPNVCTGIAVASLELNGQGPGSTYAVNGIANYNSDALGYIDQVSLYSLGGTGLVSSASGSTSSSIAAAYTNLTASSGSSASTGSECISLSQTSGLAEVHGLSCIGSTIQGAPLPQPAGVTVNAFSDTIEDTHFETLTDGILVGSVGEPAEPAQAVVIINTTGSNNISPGTTCAGQSTTCGVVHLSNVNTNITGNADVVVLATSSSCAPNCGSGLPVTLQDDVTGTTLNNPSSNSNDTDQSIGLYVLGETLAQSVFEVFSRFTTSVSQQTWGFGNGVPASSPSVTCRQGSIYSNQAAVSGSKNTIYVCQKNMGGTGTQWTPLT